MHDHTHAHHPRPRSGPNIGAGRGPCGLMHAPPTNGGGAGTQSLHKWRVACMWNLSSSIASSLKSCSGSCLLFPICHKVLSFLSQNAYLMNSLGITKYVDKNSLVCLFFLKTEESVCLQASQWGIWLVTVRTKCWTRWASGLIQQPDSSCVLLAVPQSRKHQQLKLVFLCSPFDFFPLTLILSHR